MASVSAVHKRLLRFGALLGLLALPTAVTAQNVQTFDVKSRLIDSFRIGSSQMRFGPLEFVGGLEMIGESPDFGAWSGIVFERDRQSFVGVADTGFWIEGALQRDDSGKPVGISATMREIYGQDGEAITAKWQADAEGITLDGDRIVVSFERAHRLAVYERGADNTPEVVREYAPPVPLYELRQNRGFEGIAIAEDDSPLGGALVGVAEKSLDKNKNIMGFVDAPGGEAFEFSVRRTDAFDVTDIGFLPDGDMILLERRFNINDGIAMRLRQIAAADIAKGATVDGVTLVEADMRYQIDNLEGMDITIDDDGIPRITLVSDDNHSLLQRNLLLEFRYVGAEN